MQLNRSDNGSASHQDAPTLPEQRALIDSRYRIKRLLASGGGADVYAAEHQYTRRTVALKLPRGAGQVENARVLREIEALALVQGEGIVALWDGGEAEGRPYVVFELLEGRTLAGLIAARGKLRVSETARIGVELALALARCHEAGVVHRDVKPSNLFVTPASEPQLRVLDFGIAKLNADEVPRTKLTREHALLGTPEYMAPEALLAQPDVDHRVDVYALGVTLYECLTGAVPFDGAYADVLLKLTTTAPRPVHELRSGVPAGFSDVVTRCLARAPEDRYQSMRELARAIAGAVPERPLIDLFGRASMAPPPSSLGAASTATLADSPAARRQPVEDWRTRRKQPRAPYITLARVTLSSGERIDGRLEEVSEGGLQFVGDRAVAVGEAVKLRFALPATGQMTDAGAVARWNRTVRGNNATGFQFTDVSDAARTEIGRYVAIVAPDA